MLGDLVGTPRDALQDLLSLLLKDGRLVFANALTVSANGGAKGERRG